MMLAPQPPFAVDDAVRFLADPDHATAFGGGRNAGEGQFLWPRRPPIIGHYQTLQTMVIVGRIALPLGTWTKAVGAGGTIFARRLFPSYRTLWTMLSWVGLH